MSAKKIDEDHCKIHKFPTIIDGFGGPHGILSDKRRILLITLINLAGNIPCRKVSS